jgi:cobyrinic acid a,c-diamide synthase
VVVRAPIIFLDVIEQSWETIDGSPRLNNSASRLAGASIKLLHVTPAFLISGTHSGVGKTTVSFAVMSILHELGFNVQPFKVGPDFIDPGYHKLATWRESINLDLWMMGLSNVRKSFAHFSAPADVAVIEGMGALFDGERGTERGSAGYLAKRLDVPILLVVDVWGMTRSAAALIDGFMGFDPQVRIAGVILNRAGSEGHYRMVMDSLPSRIRRLVLGYLPRSSHLSVPERHLGLLTLEENTEASKVKDALLRNAKQTLDVNRLVRLFNIKKRGVSGPPVSSKPSLPKVRVGIARDKAFCFYYKENLAMLEEAGAELLPFSPMEDTNLPDDLDGLYFGGGYPESFPDVLSENKNMRQKILEASRAGLPVYAECGGLMYMGRSLKNFDGRKYPMVSVLPIDTEMDKNYLAIKYVEIETTAETLLGPKGTKVRGQEFHHSRLVSSHLENGCYRVTTNAGKIFSEGFNRANVLASYIHLHFKSNPSVPSHFVSRCLDYRKTKRR